MTRHPRQTITTTITLAGEQHMAVKAHHAGTARASVNVRIGDVVLSFEEAATVSAVARGWQALEGEAEHLARNADVTEPTPGGSGHRPALVCRVDAGLLRAGIEQLPSTPPVLRVAFGGLAFEVRDRVAFDAVAVALRAAAAVAATTFPRPVARPVRRTAAVGRPTRDEHRVPAAAPDGPAPAQVRDSSAGVPPVAGREQSRWRWR